MRRESDEKDAMEEQTGLGGIIGNGKHNCNVEEMVNGAVNFLVDLAKASKKCS